MGVHFSRVSVKRGSTVVVSRPDQTKNFLNVITIQKNYAHVRRTRGPTNGIHLGMAEFSRVKRRFGSQLLEDGST